MSDIEGPKWHQLWLLAMSAPSCDTGWRGDDHEPCHQQLEVWLAELLKAARDCTPRVFERVAESDTGDFVNYIGNPTDPWCHRCQSHHQAPCQPTPERSEAAEEAARPPSASPPLATVQATIGEYIQGTVGAVTALQRITDVVLLTPAPSASPPGDPLGAPTGVDPREAKVIEAAKTLVDVRYTARVVPPGGTYVPWVVRLADAEDQLRQAVAGLPEPSSARHPRERTVGDRRGGGGA